jgi:hypothetical protein
MKIQLFVLNAEGHPIKVDVPAEFQNVVDEYFSILNFGPEYFGITISGIVKNALKNEVSHMKRRVKTIKKNLEYSNACAEEPSDITDKP